MIVDKRIKLIENMWEFLRSVSPLDFYLWGGALLSVTTDLCHDNEFSFVSFIIMTRIN
jgi:hypothetical protein